VNLSFYFLSSCHVDGAELQLVVLDMKCMET